MVMVIDVNSCVILVDVMVIVYENLMVVIMGDFVVCQNQIIIFMVIGVGVGGSYVWSIGENSVSIMVSFMNIEIYIVIVMDVNVCID